MTDDFFTPIRPTNPADESRIPVPPVEPDKQSKSDNTFLESDDPRRQNLLYSSLILFFKKMFSTSFFSRNDRGSKSGPELLAALHTFKELLTKLKTSDENDHPHFAELLSNAWHVLLAAPPKTPIEPLIQLVNTYPAGEMHSMGFYLSNYAGDDWLPFPFLEILKKLHQGYILRKNHSELAHMLDLVDKTFVYFSL